MTLTHFSPLSNIHSFTLFSLYCHFTPTKKYDNVWKKAKYTKSADADVASSMVHAGTFAPDFRHGVEAAHVVEKLVPVGAADHVDQVVQSANARIRAGIRVRVRRREPSVRSIQYIDNYT